MTDYTDLACPLPGCGHPLHIAWVLGRSLYAYDLSDGISLQPDQRHTSTWEVACDDGHIVLLPGDAGCPDSCEGEPDDTHDCEQFDHADDDRTFRPHDLRRLITLLSGTGPVAANPAALIAHEQGAATGAAR